ncbi:hypothetical protein NC651_030471 [Populus alba x Populus x berolinensis]|nr:hypothetical protein NC651_030471 [Populus alba x Populus x berolinensis]
MFLGLVIRLKVLKGAFWLCEITLSLRYHQWSMVMVGSGYFGSMS